MTAQVLLRRQFRRGKAYHVHVQLLNATGLGLEGQNIFALCTLLMKEQLADQQIQRYCCDLTSSAAACVKST